MNEASGNGGNCSGKPRRVVTLNLRGNPVETILCYHLGVSLYRVTDYTRMVRECFTVFGFKRHVYVTELEVFFGGVG